MAVNVAHVDGVDEPLIHQRRLQTENRGQSMRRVLLTPHLPVSVGLEAVCGSGGKIHPGVSVESEGVAARVDLDVGPVRGDDPDLAVALNLDAPPVDGVGGGHRYGEDD